MPGFRAEDSTIKEHRRKKHRHEERGPDSRPIRQGSAETTGMKANRHVPPRRKVVLLVKEGRDFFRKKRYAEAKGKFSEALLLEGDNAYALVGMGDACLRLKQFEESAGYYEQVLHADENNTFALLGLGDAHRGLGELEKSIVVLERFLLFQPGNIQVLTRIGDAFRKRGLYADAVRMYKTALDYEPYNPFALRGCADSYRGLRQYDKATEYWETYELYHPGNVAVLGRLGDSLKNIGEMEKAEKAYRAAFEVEKDYVYALLGMGYLEISAERTEEAFSWWEKALEAHSGNVIPVCRAADNYRRTGKLDIAERIYRMALDFDPTNKFLMTGLAGLDMERAEYVKAVASFRSLDEKFPDDEVILTSLGDAYNAKGDMEEATEAWGRALQLAPYNIFLLTRVGDGYRKLGRYAEAVRVYNKVLDSKGEDSRVIHGFVRLLQHVEASELSEIDERWIIRAAEFAIRKNGNEEAKQILRHLSPEGRKSLSGPLKALIETS